MDLIKKSCGGIWLKILIKELDIYNEWFPLCYWIFRVKDTKRNNGHNAGFPTVFKTYTQKRSAKIKSFPQESPLFYLQILPFSEDRVYSRESF